MRPEEPSFVEQDVETEVSGERDQSEDEGDQEEDTWTDQIMTIYSSIEKPRKGIKCNQIKLNSVPLYTTCSVILTYKTKYVFDNL